MRLVRDVEEDAVGVGRLERDREPRVALQVDAGLELHPALLGVAEPEPAVFVDVFVGVRLDREGALLVGEVRGRQASPGGRSWLLDRSCYR